MPAEERAGLPVQAFADAGDWEAWLAAHGADATGLWVKLPKKSNSSSSLTRDQVVDGGLIHGWIDGQQQPYDADWWLVRFTPRARRSKWSEKNRARAVELIADGRMTAAGRAEVDRAKADGRWDAAYAPPSTASEPPDLTLALDADPAARRFFDALDRANRYAILYRIQDAKRPETRARRIAQFAAMCAAGETIHPRKGAAS